LTTLPQTLNAAAGNLILGQTVDNGGNLLTITDGGFNTTISNTVSGTGGLKMSAPARHRWPEITILFPDRLPSAPALWPSPEPAN
jgi:hypothetical protein